MDKRNPANRAPKPAGADPMRVDPRDAQLYARRVRHAKRVGPLGKFFRYSAIALLLVGAFAVYWNFETLRGIRPDFSALTSLFEDDTGRDGQGTAAGGEPATEVVAAAGVAGTSLPSSIDDEPPEPATNAVETPPDRPAATAPVPAAPAAPPSRQTEPVPAAVAEPAPNERVAAVTPPPVEEPPAGPETFDFGLSVINFSEADASAAVLILRNGGRRRASSVTWWTTDGTAKAGNDYASFGPRVERFAVGEQNRTIRIPLVGDRNTEARESFYVHVAPGETAGASSESVAQLEVVINDDD